MARAKAVKVFLDASVLVAASASINDASAYVLELSRQRKIKALVSEDTIIEATRNVDLKLNKIGQYRLKVYLIKANLSLVENPSAEAIAVCEEIIHVKDAPILASAIENKADVLLTLDRKHFLMPKVKIFAKPLKIMLPGEFIKSIAYSV